MQAWVNERLDELLDDRLKRGMTLTQSDQTIADFDAWVEADGHLIEQACKGDLKPVHDKYPHLAVLLQKPKLGRGKYMRMRAPDPVQSAAEDVLRIRALWKEHFHRMKRGPLDGPSAIEIAAKRCGVRERHVEVRLKSMQRSSGP